ncbi:MAG: helix-hairpin-helix domain-containing protein, partial [Oscillospiraceae bacterium]
MNAASMPLLKQVWSNATTAKNIIAYREENGAFTSARSSGRCRSSAPRHLSSRQAFARAGEREGAGSYGRTPESYKAAEELLTRCGLKLADVGTQKLQELPARVKLYGEQKLAGDCQIGVPTMLDIVKELVKPGRDPRDELPAPILRTDVLELKDLKPGMELSGTVRNVIDFGVFVDIGVHQD